MELLDSLHASGDMKESITILNGIAAEAREAASSVDYIPAMRRALADSVKKWAASSQELSNLTVDLHDQKMECAIKSSTVQDSSLYDDIVSRIDSTLAYTARQRTHLECIIAQSLTIITSIDASLPSKLNSEFANLLDEIQDARGDASTSGSTADTCDSQLQCPE